MQHLINKDALVAEITKLKYIIMPYPTMAEKVAYRDGIEDAIKIVIKSLEMKEVDLEKEIKEEYLERRCYVGKDNMLVILNEPQFNEVAKHFIELGLKAQKEEEV